MASVQSPLATLDSKLSEQALRALPAAGLKTGASVNFSGQYLLDRLIENNQEEQKAEATKMDIVRAAVTQVDATSWKTCLSDMVKLARDKYGDNSSQHKSAKQYQSFLRTTYGAIRFAPEKLAEGGIDATKAGLMPMVTASAAALKEKGIKWDGTPRPADLDETERRELKRQSEEMQVLDKLKKDYPIGKNEKVTDWNDRLMARYDAALETFRHDVLVERVNKAAALIIKDHRDICLAIAAQVPVMLAAIERNEGEAAEKLAVETRKAA